MFLHWVGRSRKHRHPVFGSERGYWPSQNIVHCRHYHQRTGSLPSCRFQHALDLLRSQFGFC